MDPHFWTPGQDMMRERMRAGYAKAIYTLEIQFLGLASLNYTPSFQTRLNLGNLSLKSELLPIS